jgi:hypothetical protein
MVTEWFRARLSAVLAPSRNSRPAKSRGTQRPRLEMLEDRSVPSNIHLVGDPTFAVDGGTMTVEGKLAGLGNKDIKITVDAEGTATFDVRNPAGNEAPGITKKVNGSSSVIVEQTAFDNGHYDFSIDVTLNAGPVDLPNPQWTATLTGVTFESVSITVTQLPNGKPIDLGTFSFTG